MTNQPTYPSGPSGYAPQAQRGNGLAIAGLVLGILGLPFLVIPIFGILAIIFGGVGLARANRGAKYKGMAIAGLILGVIDIVLLVVLLVANGGSFSYHFSTN